MDIIVALTSTYIHVVVFLGGIPKIDSNFLLFFLPDPKLANLSSKREAMSVLTSAVQWHGVLMQQ